jgi:hypothetical protein
MQESQSVERLSPAEVDRLWQHRQSVDTHFNERLNFFLIFESVLLGTVAVLVDQAGITHTTPRLIAGVGLLLTIVWWYAQSKQKYILNLLRTRAELYMPEYRATRSQRTTRLYRLSVIALLAHLVPFSIGVIWVILLLAI